MLEQPSLCPHSLPPVPLSPRPNHCQTPADGRPAFPGAPPPPADPWVTPQSPGPNQGLSERQDGAFPGGRDRTRDPPATPTRCGPWP